MTADVFPSTLLQQHGLHLLAGKTQASSNRRSIPAAPCSWVCHRSSPHANKSTAFASDFLPGLFKDVSSLTRGGVTIKVEGMKSFVCRRHLTAEPPTYRLSFTGSKLTLDAQMNLIQIHPLLWLCQQTASVCSERDLHTQTYPLPLPARSVEAA